MPVNTPHPAYEEWHDRWLKCRVCYLGEEAVKAAGTDYLPKVDPGQTDAEYQAYLARASFYDAVARTVDGFVGAVARKPHTIVMPQGMDALLDDVTGDGSGLDEFIKSSVAEVLTTARGGVLVDWDDAAQRPYLTLYGAEDILSWGETIRLSERVFLPSADDPFKIEQVTQIREIGLADGRYTVTIWRERAGQMGSEWTIAETITPTRRGVPLTEIPWRWLTPKGNTARITRPPLLGLVNIALSHYRTSADLEHGRHFTGLPTLYVTGVTSDEPIRVGAATAIVLSDAAAKVGYAEFSGQGLRSLEVALDQKEQQMAALGAAIFAEAKKGVEAADTARLRHSAENSLLMGVISAVEEGIEGALRLAADWAGIAGDIDVDINRDLADTRMPPAELLALVKALQANAITLETFLFNLQQGGMLPPEAEVETEAARLGGAGNPPAEPETSIGDVE